MSKKLTFKLDVTGSGMRTDATNGKHIISIDEPVSFGGKDSAPDPMSTMLAALAACENVMVQIISKEMNIQIEDISFKVEGELDPSGLMGNLDVKPYFEKVKVEAFLKTSASQEQVDELQKKVDQRCPIYRTIKDAGIPIENLWVKN
ncbi:OsmC family protein [Cytobacillus solani]|uniref:Osmotically inducible protein C n=1 Tax=Cytobacillus solani TaxID=1637975 RepID=A0A0Q3TCG6_9BACI|nr:OsmC family protein [Cytobacillus solani]KOP83800.1 osmotically inducible protein C [Bacillus sp. FJAT-21945]KQL20877.1 osmotically inducible protein C [Cytobacillus solani]USK54119.1 OsmC family protein [Cytobacillus solani]